MFSVKIAAVRYSVARLKNFRTLLCSKQLARNLSTLTINNYAPNSLLNETSNNKCLRNRALPFSSEQLVEPADPDVFGDIGGNESDTMKLDNDEMEQDKFEMNESRLPRRMRLSPGRYARLISDHIAKGDLTQAMNVLELVKTNRDQPTAYMYNLLIRGYAVQGQLKKCFKLFNDMKKRALEPNAATYVSIINACANCSETELAVRILNKVRDEILRKNFAINVVHYNVMIKAYGKHHCILEAFQIVDEMVDKGLPIGATTFNSLLFASISNKESGLKYALTVWHLMLQRNLKPSIVTYNLLLRAMRDTKLGDMKLNHEFIEANPATRIVLCNGTASDLLSKMPIVTPLLIESIKTTEMINPPHEPKQELAEYKSSSAASAVQTVENRIMESSDESLEKICLNTIHKKNRLILFGGYTGFIRRMERSNVKPEVKTLTLLMEVAPSSLSIENDIILFARTKKIELDIDFFNMLIKRRSLRRDYKNAKAVLDEIQLHGLTPDMITWGVLALGCVTHDESNALLQGMEATGHTLNPVIATTLLNNACSVNDFAYIFDILELMSRNRVRPTEITYEVLDSFQKKISDILLGKVKSKHTNKEKYKEMFAQFNLRYNKWRQKFSDFNVDKRTNKQQYKKKFVDNKYVHTAL